MHGWNAPATRGILLSLALLGAVLHACVGGHIPPSTFQFTNIVPLVGTERSGWKVAQVIVLMGRISRLFPEAATCEVEVGVPERNVHGLVTDEFAQVAAAKAADETARIVLREQQPTALACNQFRKHMQSILGDRNFGSIPGARVTGFLEVGVPRTTFP
ncbi:hypothetical protein JRI60_31535 [Archangium violaceum]|uniref:hypothetical protein n=1 Tax=Archangium violaceum TaxID=83451 RepID=UPI00194E508E|nr:hypothetical protein [Archangium violaceum]QRN93692.1 hypothetical protein JRI60_31535 [Archangium violaceum]